MSYNRWSASVTWSARKPLCIRIPQSSVIAGPAPGTEIRRRSFDTGLTRGPTKEDALPDVSRSHVTRSDRGTGTRLRPYVLSSWSQAVNGQTSFRTPCIPRDTAGRETFADRQRIGE